MNSYTIKYQTQKVPTVGMPVIKDNIAIGFINSIINDEVEIILFENSKNFPEKAKKICAVSDPIEILLKKIENNLELLHYWKVEK